MLDSKFRLFPEIPLAHSPHCRASAPSATASERPHSPRQLRLFPSVLRLLPAWGTEKGGRTKTRWVKGRDTGKGRGPGSGLLALGAGRVKEKKGRSRGWPKKVARDKSSQRGERCARPLRRLVARLCAPAQDGKGGARDGLLRLRRRWSEARFLTPRGRVPEPPARVRETFPSSREGAEFLTVKLGRLVLVAVATA